MSALEAQADAVVRLVPAQFVGERAVCGVLVDHKQFGAHHRREVGQFLDTEGRVSLAGRLTSLGTGRLVGWASGILLTASLVLIGMAMVRFKRGKLTLD